VTPAGGSATTLVTNEYDNYNYNPNYNPYYNTVGCPVAGLADRDALFHDGDHYGSGFRYRGNMTKSTTLGHQQCMSYETTGVVAGAWKDGQTVNISLSGGTGDALPRVVAPGGDADLGATVNNERFGGGTRLTRRERGQGTASRCSVG